MFTFFLLRVLCHVSNNKLTTLKLKNYGIYYWWSDLYRSL